MNTSAVGNNLQAHSITWNSSGAGKMPMQSTEQILPHTSQEHPVTENTIRGGMESTWDLIPVILLDQS